MKKLLLPLLLLTALAAPLTGCTGTEQAQESEPQVTVMRFDEDIDISYLHCLDDNSYLYTYDVYDQGLMCLAFADADGDQVVWSTPIPDMGGSMFDSYYLAPAQDGFVLRDQATSTLLLVNTTQQTVTELSEPYEQMKADITKSYDAEMHPLIEPFYLDGQQWLAACRTHEPGEYHRISTDLYLWSPNSIQKLPQSICDGIMNAVWGGLNNDTLYLLTYWGQLFSYTTGGEAAMTTDVTYLTDMPPIATGQNAGWLAYNDIMPIAGTNDIAALFFTETTDDVAQIFSDEEYTFDGQQDGVNGGPHFDNWFTVTGGESRFIGAHTDKIYLLQTYKYTIGPEGPAESQGTTIEHCRIIQYDRTADKQQVIFDTTGWSLEQPGHLRLYSGSVSPDGSHLLLEGLYYTFSTLSHVDPAEQILLRLDLE